MKLITVGVVLSLCSVTAANAEDPSGFPLISGKYNVSITMVCQPTVQVSYSNIGGNNVVTGVSMSSTGTSKLTAGTAKATNTSGSGSFSYNATQSKGDPIIVQDNLGGEWGTALSVASGTGSSSFTQTATTLAITDSGGTSTYNVYYGLVKKGVAESFVYGGLDDKGCVQAAGFTRS